MSLAHSHHVFWCKREHVESNNALIIFFRLLMVEFHFIATVSTT